MRVSYLEIDAALISLVKHLKQSNQECFPNFQLPLFVTFIIFIWQFCPTGQSTNKSLKRCIIHAIATSLLLPVI